MRVRRGVLDNCDSPRRFDNLILHALSPSSIFLPERSHCGPGKLAGTSVHDFRTPVASESSDFLTDDVLKVTHTHTRLVAGREGLVFNRALS